MLSELHVSTWSTSAPIEAAGTSFLWGLRAGQWWLVVCRDGEPHEAYHQQYGRTEARRGTFEKWASGEAPAPHDGEKDAATFWREAHLRDTMRLHAQLMEARRLASRRSTVIAWLRSIFARRGEPS